MDMDKAFIYGMSVEGKNFTDRELETKRLQLNFENGMNSILISPRRIGKTSLVKKVKSLTEGKDRIVVFMDIYKRPRNRIHPVTRNNPKDEYPGGNS